MKKYEIVTRTKDLTREQWLIHRKGGIGGSDVSILCGISKYKTPLQLWLDKTSNEVEETTSEAAYWGTTLEDIVAREFSKRTGKKVKNFNAVLRSKDRPYMYANLDRLIVGENAFLECKTSSVYLADQWKDDKIPDVYMLQVQHYMYVLGCEYCYIACLLGGNTFIYKKIDRDNDMIASIIALEEDFWNKVVNKVAPSVDGSEASVKFVNSIYPTHEGETKLSDDDIKWIDRYHDLKAKEKELEEELNLCLNHLKQDLKEYKQGTCGDWIVRWAEQNRNSLDTKKLKAEAPEVYEKYLKSSIVKKFEIKENKIMEG